MASYTADISYVKGKDVKIRIVDNAITDWGLFFADDFVTNYSSEEELPTSASEAINLL